MPWHRGMRSMSAPVTLGFLARVPMDLTDITSIKGSTYERSLKCIHSFIFKRVFSLLSNAERRWWL